MKNLYAVLLLLILCPFLVADTPEPGSKEAIAKDTTEPRYISPWVSYIPESKDVPSPEKYLGHIAGAAGELASTKEIYGYFRELAKASKRVHLEVIGHTEEGREILLAAIADEAGIQNLEQLKAATAALSDPRKTTPQQAEEIIRTARPMYYFNAAIHADESISPDMSMELAYRLAVSDQPMIQNIRQKVIVLINPCGNPDGRDKMVDWFHEYIKGKTDYDTLPRQSPPYWGKYVYVDANRDAHQLALATTQAVAKMFFAYHPVVIHDLHEAIALLETWNGTGPFNPNLDPIVWSEFLAMSFHEMSTMSGFGMPGVWTWNFGEGFAHTFTDSVAMNHNSIGRGYETFGNAVPLTLTRKLDPEDVSVEWYRPIPPPERKFVWSHRDGLNYAETGCLSILDYTANNAAQFLRNFYQKGYDSWQRGKNGNPYAFIVPAEQEDRLRVAQMLNRLMSQGIEVSRASAAFQTKEGKFSAGTYVIRLDQPYRNYAVDLLTPQQFPSDPEHEPYDDVSWALPMHYGVQTLRVDDAAIGKVALERITADLHPEGRLRGSGPIYLLKDNGQEGIFAARFRLAKFKIEIAEEPFQSGNISYPRGSWILRDQPDLGAAIHQTAKELALDFDSVSSIPNVKSHEATLPRVGIYVPWADTDMIGWIRYTFDQEKVPYTYLRDEDIRAGDLRKSVDVIIYGNVLLDLQGQIQGIEAKNGPMPFKKTAQYPSLGTPAESDDITGGLGWNGLANLQKFVEEGGVFATLGRSCALVLETGFVRNIKRAELSSFTTLGNQVTNVSTPGAELRTKITRPDHPIAYGYPTNTSVFRSNYAIYDPPRRWLTMSYCTSCLSGPYDMREVVMQWGTKDLGVDSSQPVEPIIISGGGHQAETLEGRPAIFDIPQGKGHVIAYNFNPMHRDLNHSDYRFLWNAILNWDHLPPLP
jgi:Zinc carboxypeptidase